MSTTYTADTAALVASHIHDDPDYGAELVLTIQGGTERQIRTDALTDRADGRPVASYVRVTEHDGRHEVAYWTVDEIAEDHKHVIPAILGAAGGNTRTDPPGTILPAGVPGKKANIGIDCRLHGDGIEHQIVLPLARLDHELRWYTFGTSLRVTGADGRYTVAEASTEDFEVAPGHTLGALLAMAVTGDTTTPTATVTLIDKDGLEVESRRFPLIDKEDRWESPMSIGDEQGFRDVVADYLQSAAGNLDEARITMRITEPMPRRLFVIVAKFVGWPEGGVFTTGVMARHLDQAVSKAHEEARLVYRGPVRDGNVLCEVACIGGDVMEDN